MPTPSQAIAIGLVVVFGLIYVSRLGGALSVDEVTYARAGHGLFHGEWYRSKDDLFVPTGRYLTGVGTALVGLNAVGARLPFAVVGAAGVSVTYLIGTEVESRSAGAFAALLVGATPLYARHATRAVPDILLTLFTLTAVYGLLRWQRTPDSRWLVLVGIALAGVVTTKQYGFLYAAPVLLGVAWIGARRNAWRSLSPMVGAGLLATGLVYVPYLFAPPAPAQSNRPEIIQTLVGLPGIGNVVYVFGAGVVLNVLHLDAGHAVTIGDTVYQTAPVWSYLYWIADSGAVYLVGVLLLVPGVAWLGRDRVAVALVALAILGPLAGLSLLTVKFPRYILPTLPLIVVVETAVVVTAIRGLLERVSSGSQSDVAVGVAVLVLASLAFVPPSPVTTDVGTDTGYDDIANTLMDHESGSCAETVLSYHATALRFYLQPTATVTVIDITPTDLGTEAGRTRFQDLRDDLVAGNVSYVVIKRPSRRLEATDLHAAVVQRGEILRSVDQSSGESLVLYRIPNASCE